MSHPFPRLNAVQTPSCQADTVSPVFLWRHSSTELLCLRSVIQPPIISGLPAFLDPYPIFLCLENHARRAMTPCPQPLSSVGVAPRNSSISEKQRGPANVTSPSRPSTRTHLLIGCRSSPKDTPRRTQLLPSYPSTSDFPAAHQERNAETRGFLLLLLEDLQLHVENTGEEETLGTNASCFPQHRPYLTPPPSRRKRHRHLTSARTRKTHHQFLGHRFTLSVRPASGRQHMKPRTSI